MNWEKIILEGLKTGEDLSEVLNKAAEAAPDQIREILEKFPESMSAGEAAADFRPGNQGKILLLLWYHWLSIREDFSTDPFSQKENVIENVAKASIRAAQLASILEQKELEVDHLMRAGAVFYFMRKYSKSQSLYKKALKLVGECSHQPDSDSNRAMILNNLGNIYCDTGRFSEAIKAYHEALTLWRTPAKRDSRTHYSGIAMALNNLGLLYADHGEFSQSEEFFNKALAMRRILAEKDHTHEFDVAMTLSNLGDLYCDTGRFSEAEAVYREALCTFRTLAEVNPRYYRSLAMVLNSVGILFCKTGKFSQAKKVYTEALALRRKLAQEDPDVHCPDVADTLTNLGNIYTHMREFSQAEKVYTEALALRKELAQKNPAMCCELERTLNNLGALYSQMGRYLQAEKAYVEALALRRELARKNPAQHANVAMTLNNLGNFYSEVYKDHEAEKAYTEALAITRELARKDSVYCPDVADTLTSLGNLYIAIGKFSQAEKVYTEALAVYRTLAETDPLVYTPDVAMTLNNLGKSYSLREKDQKAEEVYTEALTLYRTLAETDPVYDSGCAMVLNNLGILYVSTDNTKAEKFLNESLKIRKNKGFWFELVETYRILSLLFDDKREDAVLVLELAILFSGEKKYKYAQKGRRESIYNSILEKEKDSQRIFGILEALRDPDLLSLQWDLKKIEKARNDKNLQKKLVKNLLKKKISPLKVFHFQILPDVLFLYIQRLETSILYLAATQEGATLVRGTPAFADCGKKLLTNLHVQMLGGMYKKDLSNIIKKFDTLSAEWTHTMPPEIVTLLCEKDVIILSPDATCSYFPLEGLVIDGEPICLSKKVVRATSMHQLQEIVSRTLITDSSLIVGNPWPPHDEKSLLYHPGKIGPIKYLENAEKEARMLAENLPNPEILLTSSATADTFSKELPNHSLIHFAGHGHLGRVLFFSGPMKRFSPEFEPEEFSQLRKAWRSLNGKTIYMMDEWDLITDIDVLETPLQKGAFIFLSACETGKHTYAGGGHFQGLAQAFLKSGASHVISSLIPLYDEPSTDFALSFYKFLSQKPVSTALQNTRKKMKEKYKAHIYWLPYIHYGSPFVPDSDSTEPDSAL